MQRRASSRREAPGSRWRIAARCCLACGSSRTASANPWPLPSLGARSRSGERAPSTASPPAGEDGSRSPERARVRPPPPARRKGGTIMQANRVRGPEKPRRAMASTSRSEHHRRETPEPSRRSRIDRQAESCATTDRRALPQLRDRAGSTPAAGPVECTHALDRSSTMRPTPFTICTPKRHRPRLVRCAIPLRALGAPRPERARARCVSPPEAPGSSLGATYVGAYGYRVGAPRWTWPSAPSYAQRERPAIFRCARALAIAEYPCPF